MSPPDAVACYSLLKIHEYTTQKYNVPTQPAVTELDINVCVCKTTLLTAKLVEVWRY